MTTEAQLKQRLNAAQRHQINCANAAPPRKVWHYREKRIKSVRLFTDELGEWYLLIDGGARIAATDAEVWLWLKVIELEAVLKGYSRPAEDGCVTPPAHGGQDEAIIPDVCAEAMQKAKQAHTTEGK